MLGLGWRGGAAGFGIWAWRISRLFFLGVRVPLPALDPYTFPPRFERSRGFNVEFKTGAQAISLLGTESIPLLRASCSRPPSTPFRSTSGV